MKSHIHLFSVHTHTLADTGKRSNSQHGRPNESIEGVAAHTDTIVNTAVDGVTLDMIDLMKVT